MMKLKGVVVGLPCFPNDSSIPPAPLAIHNRSVGMCERDGGSVNGVAKERIGGQRKNYHCRCRWLCCKLQDPTRDLLRCNLRRRPLPTK